MEIAFVSANRFKIEVDRKKGLLAGSIIGGFLEQPSRFISALLVGNNIALVVYGITMAKVLEPWIRNMTHSESIILLLQTVLSTLLILVTAEFLPKAFFRINPNRMLDIFAVPAKVFYVLLYPLVWVIDRFSKQILSALFKVKLNEEKMTFGRSDLDEYVNEFTGNDEEESVDSEIQIFRNALNFSDIKVRECMIPRTEIIALDISTEIDELRQKLVDTGLSKILIYRGDIDNIIGYVHSFELFQKPSSINSIIRPINLIPESTKVKDLLKQFGQQHRSVAVVLNEFGGTAGMITVEDIIEEIVGDISDEFDDDEVIYSKLDENNFIFEGKTNLKQFYRVLKIDGERFEENKGEADTLAGFILEQAGKIPAKNQRVQFENFEFTIESVDKRRIKRVKATRHQTEEATEDDT